MGSFTNINWTDGGTNWDFGWVVALEGWSLREVPLYCTSLFLDLYMQLPTDITPQTRHIKF